ncbi:formyltransferase family protein [Butyrivibrio sp. VCD2006]|uniref:formyltransferase family protein n=1 Tax=Butyrivibrio sp. VCD2006 TaxID=1280664 RepID=UPI0003F9C9D1|nr:formyltransferase family protein [Butyrivibrio sp. VCD2006]
MIGYSQVIVIGYGMVAVKVLSYVDTASKNHGYSVIYVEHEMYLFNGAKKYAESNNIDYFVIEDKFELTQFFSQRAKHNKLLIVSANNNYLFPKVIVEDDNVTIINFHNALLPDLPGRNAASWAIYKGYKKTGITWHYVSEGVDEGDIIIQKECSIGDDTRAYELAAVQMKLASESFGECLDKIIEDSVVVKKQNIENKRKVYKSTEIPGDGMFDINDDPKDIYKLLRAVDYGKSDVFPKPFCIINNKKIEIKRYKKVNENDEQKDENELWIPYGDGTYLVMRYEIIQDGLDF